MTNVSDRLIETLSAAGVERIYGLVGDSLNGITDALRRHGRMRWVGVRHEEVAAFAAGAEAGLTGNLTVCAGSCGPGNLHLINGLFDCHRSRVPVVALAAHIPSSEIGSGYFQETHPEQLFKECSHYVELVSSAAQIPRVMETAIREAVTQRGVAVVVIPGDVALQDAGPQLPTTHPLPLASAPAVSTEGIAALAKFLNESSRVTLMCGAGCAGAHDEVVQLASKLKAPVVHALRGKEHVEWDNPFDVGMTGLIGFSSGYYAMLGCEALLLLGTDFPYRQFYPRDARIAQIDIRGENLGKRCKLDLGLIGDVRATLGQLLEHVQQKTDESHLRAARNHYASARRELDGLAEIRSGQRRIHPQSLARVISETASEDAIFTADVGEPTVWAARYLKMNGKRRLLGSFLHGSMANAMPQAIGAQCAFPNRQVISLSGDGGFSMLMGDILTIRQEKLPVKIVVFNNGLLGFVDIEMKASGFLPTGTQLDNPNFADMARAIGIHGIRIENSADLPGGIAAALEHPGPVLVDVVTDPLELVMPPKITLEQVKGFSIWMMKAVLNGRGNELVELARNALDR